jgi:hypothetical protein
VLEAAAQEHPAALGPTVEWARGGMSARRAIATHRLAAAGRLPRGGSSAVAIAATAAGGTTASAVATASGGATTPGGATASGGASASGGATASGGVTASGGALPAGGLIVADDHLAELLIAADAEVAADLAASRLAPLADLPDGPRARLRETLAGWLDRPGQVQAVAAALDVHPQTVRYRLRQLRDLFGERLEDPDARFELALALRVS